MKYCEDCKWFKWNWLTGKSSGKCSFCRAKLDDDAMVTRKSAPYATIERKWGNCGKGAVNFEPK